MNNTAARGAPSAPHSTPNRKANTVENIHRYRDELESELRALLDSDTEEGFEALLNYFLDIEIWTSSTRPDCPRVELLITCGGPTVRLEYDHGSETAELYHSWGKLPSGEERTVLDFRGSLVLEVLERLGALGVSE